MGASFGCLGAGRRVAAEHVPQGPEPSLPFRACRAVSPATVLSLNRLDQAATINMALSRNGCVMPRELCEIISKNWIFPNPFDKEPFDANVAEKKASFKEAGIEYTIRQIDEYRACGINGIHLYALNKFDDVARIAKEAGLLDLI